VFHLLKIMFIKVKLKALEVSLLLNYLEKLKKKDNQLKVVGLPKKNVRFTILTSPHVNIRAREHYELNISNMVLYIKSSSFIIPPAGIAYKITFLKSFC